MNQIPQKHFLNIANVTSHLFVRLPTVALLSQNRFSCRKQIGITMKSNT